MGISSSTIALDLQVQRTKLEVVIINEGTEMVRIWDRNNSWGYSSLLLDVAAASQPEDVYSLTPKPRIWTRNIPVPVDIPAGGRHAFVLTADEPEWDGLESISHLRNEPIRVRANLEIPKSREAEKHGVFVGAVSSQWRESQPPHRWLFASP